MGYNINVSKATEKMVDAYGTSRFPTARENYYKVLEKELRKDLSSGWCDWIYLEDPSDALYEAIYNKDDVDFIEEVLNGYIRFIDVCERCNHPSIKKDVDLINKAIDYCSNC